MIDVSDHALVRWLQRRHGMDMEGFRAMLAEEVARVPARRGECRMVLDGFSYLIVNGVLVTVMEYRGSGEPISRR